MVAFGLVGCGRIGQRHAAHISTYGQLQAVCDVDATKANELANQYGCKAYYTIVDLLQNEPAMQVVSICTPNGLHAMHSIAALNAGLHVLCEKPLAISVYDSGEMIKAAERANRRLFVIKQNRFNPPVAAVKRAIDAGHLGKIYSLQLSCFWNRNAGYYQDSLWKGTKALDGGTLYTQFSHFIDLLYWMFGDVNEVAAYTSNYAHRDIIEFEDTGVVILRFYSGIIGTLNYTVNAYQKNMEGSLTIFGEKGTVKIGGQYLNELEYQNIQDYEIKNLPAGNKPNSYGGYEGSMSNHAQVYENVIRVLQGNDVISTSGFEGLKTVEIIDKIYRAARSNEAKLV